MKKRFLLVLAVAVCLLALVLAIPAMADGAPATSVMGHNLALEDAVDIIYYVDFQNVPGGAESGVLVWRNPQDSYTYGTEDAKLSTVGKDYGYDKFVFPGVSAKMMTQDIYAVSYIKNGGEITYSTLDKYSVLQYAYNMKGNQTVLPGGTATLDELLTDMLNYGTTAQKHFGYKTDRLANATYYQIKVEGGTLPDGATKGLFQVGENVTLTAGAENFYRWKNSSGEMLEANNSFLVTVGEKAEKYTAMCYSQGLEFTSNGDGTCYVAGIGTCTDTDIVIPPVSPSGNTVIAVGRGAPINSKYPGFSNCTQITSCVIPDSVTSISFVAFYNCTALASITIPDSVTSISMRAFSNCAALTSVTIPSSVTNVGEGVFAGCSKLTEIVVAESNPIYHSTGNCIIKTASKALIAGCKASVIPTDGSVTSIGTEAFYNCNTLESITISDKITSIGDWAFTYCESLTSITLPDSVTSIGSHTFGGCTSLVNITVSEGNKVYHSAGNCLIQTASKALIAGCKTSVIPTNGSIASIEWFAFYRHSSLSSITIPNSITNIEYGAFMECTSLETITFLGTAEEWDTIEKGNNWDYNVGYYIIHCTDGDIAK